MRLLFALLFIVALPSWSCVLTMGYRTSERLPYINAEPNNTGVFVELYRSAAKRIGCELEVVRAPKNRIIRDLMHGNIDFYPSLGFNRDRLRFTHFIANGLPEHYIGVSRDNIPEIRSTAEVANLGMLLLMSPGGYDLGGLPPGIEKRQPMDLDVPKALSMLKASKGDFFIYDEYTLSYYIERDQISGLKLHQHCCEAEREMYLGFSRKSPHYQDETNPDFRTDLPIGPSNQPKRSSEGSIAHRFAAELEKMQQEGTTDAMLQLAIYPKARELLERSEARATLPAPEPQTATPEAAKPETVPVPETQTENEAETTTEARAEIGPEKAQPETNQTELPKLDAESAEKEAAPRLDRPRPT
ncbi:transporter substrate-binding domain-containing protein [Shewanella sp. JM162201]|uniref:Transporter substrate-binding domain-containing protein n=1 Tax=Shewanella jiangmenensis TaxID=2837387 RepID=A0ABS5V0J1_9GAMM|nr:transporter substrate-binding domain-containing protein [Shewanella jiangmenensis]MBT1443982.1 transporter substrate-binding domain-containing protein [Shewanella jiangmenensis]